MQTIACYALTSQGLSLAKNIATHFEMHIYVPEKMRAEGTHSFSSLPQLLAHTFNKYKGHIFITATGIAVRSIAPHLVHKGQDPAVVVCDELGKFAISLLSGHWGGGNELANELATKLAKSHNTTAIITTASDLHNTLAIDMLAKETGCIVLDWDKIKYVNSALLHRQAVQLYDPLNIFDAYTHIMVGAGISMHKSFDTMSLNLPSVGVHIKILPENENFLRLTLPSLCVGVGCKRGTSKEEILNALAQTLAKEKFEPRALACLASAKIKQDEQGLIDAAKELDLPLRLFDEYDLSNVRCLNPSKTAAKLFKVESISVSEGAALLGAGDNAKLVVSKIKYFEKITIAIAVLNITTKGWEV